MSDAETSLAMLRKLVAELPERRATAERAAAGLAGRTIPAQSAGGEVSVDVTARGVVTAIRFAPTALRNASSATIAQRITQAVNAALEAADEVAQDVPELGGGPGQGPTEDEIEQAFMARMDGLLTELDEIGQRIDAIRRDMP